MKVAQNWKQPNDSQCLCLHDIGTVGEQLIMPVKENDSSLKYYV